MAEHTEGPWVADDGDCGAWQVFQEENGSEIAWCTNQLGAPFHGRTLEESKANARLIAAAPDLLAVIEKLDGLWGRLSIGTCPPQEAVALGSQMLRALAKATGEPHD